MPWQMMSLWLAEAIQKLALSRLVRASTIQYGISDEWHVVLNWFRYRGVHWSPQICEQNLSLAVAPASGKRSWIT
jgi:hypothetical protein